MTTGIQRAVRWHPQRLLLALALVLAAIASGYGISQVRASHTDPNEVHFCVSYFTNQIRHLQNPALCTNGYVVTVNQQGPQGDQGPQGPPGDQGQQGDPGPAGTTDTIIREEIDNEIEPGTSHETIASCEASEVATGGGYFSTAINLVYPRAIGPVGAAGSQPTEWRAIWVNNQVGDGIGGVWVICAQP